MGRPAGAGQVFSREHKGIVRVLRRSRQRHAAGKAAKETAQGAEDSADGKEQSRVAGLVREDCLTFVALHFGFGNRPYSRPRTKRYSAAEIRGPCCTIIRAFVVANEATRPIEGGAGAANSTVGATARHGTPDQVRNHDASRPSPSFRTSGPTARESRNLKTRGGGASGSKHAR